MLSECKGFSPGQELADVAARCGYLLAPGSAHAFLAEHRNRLFSDKMFEDLFPSGRGRPSVPADVIAKVMGLQALERPLGSRGYRRLETDIWGKAAAGSALGDEAKCCHRLSRENDIKAIRPARQVAEGPRA
jgi:hypothetical protein